MLMNMLVKVIKFINNISIGDDVDSCQRIQNGRERERERERERSPSLLYLVAQPTSVGGTG